MRWRIAVAGLMIAVVAVVAAARAAGGAPARPTASTVMVRPHSGSATTRFVVSFRAPQATGRSGGMERRYVVEARGPNRAGCQGSDGAGMSAARAGQLVHATLGPRDGRSCAGTFHGVVEEQGRPFCEAGRACPLFIAVLPR